MGCEVDFGHRTFKWTSEAPGAAAVHCVIVGFSNTQRPNKRRRLFSYPSITGQPIETVPDRLNFYLFDGADYVPVKLRRPLVEGMPFATQGNKPVDGGHLLLDEAAMREAVQIPEVAPYVKRFVQARDMLQGSPLRWCLWLVDAQPQHLRHPFIRHRLDLVAESRLKSPTVSVQEYAAKPALFTQNRQPEGSYFALPEVSSENRRWIPGQFYDTDVIAGNKLIIFPNAEPWHAALLQSSMFMAWVETFAGRLESRYSLAPGLAYFPIPWPELDQRAQQQLADRFEQVADARAVYPDATLADLYDPAAMPSQLIDAHTALDRTVDKAFGAAALLRSNDERLALIFERNNTP